MLLLNGQQARAGAESEKSVHLDGICIMDLRGGCKGEEVNSHVGQGGQQRAHIPRFTNIQAHSPLQTCSYSTLGSLIGGVLVSSSTKEGIAVTEIWKRPAEGEI